MCVYEQVFGTVCPKCCYIWVSCCWFQSTVLKLEGFLQTSAPPEHRDLYKRLLNSSSKPRSRCGDSRLWFLAWPLLLLLKSWIEGCSDRTGWNAASQRLLCAMMYLLVMAQQLSEKAYWLSDGEKKHVPLKFVHFWIYWYRPKSQMLIWFTVSQNTVKLWSSVFIWLWGFISSSTFCCGNITAWWCSTQWLFLFS